MTEKRFKLHITWLNNDYEEGEAELKDGSQPLALFDSVEDARIVRDLLNELHDEKEWLEMNNKDLVSFIKSKGYTLKDFLKYIGQFRSVGVNKEDWND